MKTCFKPSRGYTPLQNKSHSQIENYMLCGKWISILIERNGLLTAELNEQEVLDWIIENNIQCVIDRHIPSFTLWFINEEDAAHFKLRFCK